MLTIFNTLIIGEETHGNYLSIIFLHSSAYVYETNDLDSNGILLAGIFLIPRSSKQSHVSVGLLLRAQGFVDHKTLLLTLSKRVSQQDPCAKKIFQNLHQS